MTSMISNAYKMVLNYW